MVVRQVVRTDKFDRDLRKVRDSALKERVKNQITKVIEDPEVGKPLRYSLKGERSVRVTPYRLTYAIQGDTLVLLRFEHRKEVYD